MKTFLKISHLLVAFLFLLAVSGCEKLSDKELLTDHTWKWNKLTTSSTNETVLAGIALSNALLTGTTLKFDDDGTYIMTSPLAPDDPETGTWLLSDGGETLSLDNEPMSVVTLDKEALVLESEEESQEAGSYTVTMHWKK